MKTFIFLSLVTFAFACGESPKPSEEVPVKSDTVAFKIFQLTDSSGTMMNEWGYDIYIHDKLYVHQPNIPAVQGTSGFSSEEDAMRTAQLVAFKIRNGILPPSVTKEELDSLKIKFR